MSAAPPPPSEILFDAVQQMSPVQTRRPLRTLAGVMALSLAWATGWLALGLRSSLRALSVLWLTGVGALWAAGFLAPLILALLPPRGQVLPRTRLAGIAAVLGAAGLVAAPIALEPEGALRLVGVEWLRVSGWCFAIALAVAFPPLVVAMRALKRGLPTGARSAGAAVGAANGALGGLVLHLHCPWAEASHVALAHGGAVAAAALLGAVLGPRLLLPRERRPFRRIGGL